MKRKMIFLVIILIFISLLAFDSRLKIMRYKLITDKIDGPIRIALITDLHSCKYGEKQSVLIDAIDAEKPDIILLGGDIFDDVMPNDNAMFLLENIGNRYPCYYVTGNHEVWSGESNAIKEMVKSVGVKLLEGTSEILQINNNKLQISGIDDIALFKLNGNESHLTAQLEDIQRNIDKSLYQILLYHRPQEAKLYLSYGFDLMLSGHAHGGQWRIPFLLNGLLAPDQGLFPKLAGGLYAFDTAHLIVSRGLARETTKVPRVFNRPELVIIDLSN